MIQQIIISQTGGPVSIIVGRTQVDGAGGYAIIQLARSRVGEQTAAQGVPILAGTRIPQNPITIIGRVGTEIRIIYDVEIHGPYYRVGRYRDRLHPCPSTRNLAIGVIGNNSQVIEGRVVVAECYRGGGGPGYSAGGASSGVKNAAHHTGAAVPITRDSIRSTLPAPSRGGNAAASDSHRKRLSYEQRLVRRRYRKAGTNTGGQPER